MDYLTENANKDGVTVTDSGLQYKVLAEGDGAQPGATDTVEVHYTGTLTDGKKFDSSRDRGQTIEFPLNRVIAGWTAIQSETDSITNTNGRIDDSNPMRGFAGY